MYCVIVTVENGRVTKYAEFLDLESAQAHAAESLAPIIYNGSYRPDLFVNPDNTVTHKSVFNREPHLEEYRQRRELYLNRLAGLKLFETATGLDAALAAFRQDLLDIPTMPSVMAAVDALGLRTAIMTEYKAAVARAKLTCPEGALLFDKVSK